MTEVLRKIVVPTHKLFKVGDLLIHHHGPAGFIREKDQKWFKCLSAEDCEQLVPGDEVWLEYEISQNGKIYGRKLIKLNSVIEKNSGLLINYDFSSHIVKDCDIAILTDEQQVYGWTKNEYYSRQVR